MSTKNIGGLECTFSEQVMPRVEEILSKSKKVFSSKTTRPADAFLQLGGELAQLAEKIVDTETGKVLKDRYKPVN